MPKVYVIDERSYKAIRDISQRIHRWYGGAQDRPQGGEVLDLAKRLECVADRAIEVDEDKLVEMD